MNKEHYWILLRKMNFMCQKHGILHMSQLLLNTLKEKQREIHSNVNNGSLWVLKLWIIIFFNSPLLIFFNKQVVPLNGEGNDNPLQCSCLENPRDGGAWWAAVYGVTQGRTRLKRLSSSSINICTIPAVDHLMNSSLLLSSLKTEPRLFSFVGILKLLLYFFPETSSFFHRDLH